ncbi:unnamed protein product [Paramecium sonneborni]|uniref:Uncharacterized protein n=1 Tax=Paramecium sonneborni TaxID=65129 RepID=A0A8S1RST9_9CILI|nr:unnamed protein product [Paramecium sonneborni]
MLDIQNTINTIDQLLINNQFDPTYQTISFDDKKFDRFKYSKRKHQQENIEKTLQFLISKYDKYPLVLELFLFEKIHEMRVNLQNWTNLDLDESQEEKKYLTLLQNYEKKNQQLSKDAFILITNLIDGQLKVNLEPFYKFEMSQSLKQNLIDQIMGFKIFKYFENSRNIYKCVKTDFYNKLLIDHAVPTIINYVFDYIKLQILILISELI